MKRKSYSRSINRKKNKLSFRSIVQNTKNGHYKIKKTKKGRKHRKQREIGQPPNIICVVGYVPPSFDEPLSGGSNQSEDQFKFSDESEISPTNSEEFSPREPSF